MGHALADRQLPPSLDLLAGRLVTTHCCRSRAANQGLWWGLGRQDGDMARLRTFDWGSRGLDVVQDRQVREKVKI